jgi:hypothetical protein
LISEFGIAAIPAYSILTYFRTPLLSKSLVPPNALPIPPSIVGSDVLLVFALPNITIPPQSPGVLSPTALPDVNTIGFAAVPSAIICAPLSIHNAPFSLISEIIVVPG